jgi:hypothetical protein
VLNTFVRRRARYRRYASVSECETFFMTFSTDCKTALTYGDFRDCEEKLFNGYCPGLLRRNSAYGTMVKICVPTTVESRRLPDKGQAALDIEINIVDEIVATASARLRPRLVDW